MKNHVESYPFPIYHATKDDCWKKTKETSSIYTNEHAGWVREIEGHFIFITDPNYIGLDVGYDVPDGWTLDPVNQLAKKQMGNDSLSLLPEEETQQEFEFRMLAAHAGYDLPY